MAQQARDKMGLPARAPPQVEMDFDQGGAGPEEWPDMDQTAGTGSATWE
ncbi:MAG: hypothetical protein KAH56_04250 [Candidatus Krumholzibacteria bacterium]|nr:hypothetical protein [Candidatus Krumholzibacteria bacterium]